MVHLILQRSHSIYHSWKYAVHNENRIAVVWPGCSHREVRQLSCYEAFWTSRVLILQAPCWHVRLGFSPLFFPSPKEWKTLYLHRVMAVLLHLKLHHLPHEQSALLFLKWVVEAYHIWSFRYLGWLTFLHQHDCLFGKNAELQIMAFHCFHPCWL